MEQAERERILEVAQHNIALRRLYQEHEKLENRLSAIQRRKFMTTEEEVEAKQLKIRKLQGVDRMMEMLGVASP
ncbi:MAG: hypothetical protein K1X79_02265 [Oligoflexia bacterium]|nr:hypothetical protein [Oligoflexia bacterium]